MALPLWEHIFILKNRNHLSNFEIPPMDALIPGFLNRLFGLGCWMNISSVDDKVHPVSEHNFVYTLKIIKEEKKSNWELIPLISNFFFLCPLNVFFQNYLRRRQLKKDVIIIYTLFIKILALRDFVTFFFKYNI